MSGAAAAVPVRVRGRPSRRRNSRGLGEGALDDMRSISRREILQYASALMAWSAAGACRAPIATTPKFAKDPFTLGVASGDPLPDGVVLWTRLAPEPLAGGGMSADAVEVKWEVAADEQMKQIVQRGIAQARPELGHAVHVDVRGLEPGRPYFYRFNAGSHATAIGRTRTAPAAGVMADKLRFAFASCQHWEQGYFTRLRSHGPRRPRPRRPPRRLHLRRRPAPEHRARAQRPRDHDAGRLPQSLRALSRRSVAPRRARDVPVHRHLGRSRGRQRLRRRSSRRRSDARRVPDAAGPRVSGLLRAHAAARGGASESGRDAALSPPRVRSARGFPGARHASVPHRSAVRQESRAALRRRARSEGHHPRRRSGSAG